MMSFFAFEGGVSTDQIETGVPITEEQYQAALEAMSEGQEVTVDGGFAVREQRPSEHHSWEGGQWVEHPPEPPEPSPPTLYDYENAIQAMVDATAREKLFRDGVTLASYVNSADPQWAAEAVTFVAWRDDVWRYAYAELAKVQGGLRPQPSVAEFIAEITPIVWPA